jgi:hypothetical protein
MLATIGSMYLLLNAIIVTIGLYIQTIEIVWIVHGLYFLSMLYYFTKYKYTSKLLLMFNSSIGILVVCLFFYMLIKALSYTITSKLYNADYIARMHIYSVIKYNLVYLFVGLTSCIHLMGHKKYSYQQLKLFKFSIVILVIYTFWVASKTEYIDGLMWGSGEKLKLGQNYSQIADSLICYLFMSSILIQSPFLSFHVRNSLIVIISICLVVISTLISSKMLLFCVLIYILFYAFNNISVILWLPSLFVCIPIYITIFGYKTITLASDSLLLRWEIIESSIMKQLGVNIMFGDLGAEYIARGQYIHSLPLHMQTHYGILGSILLFCIFIVILISLKNAPYNLLIISFILLAFSIIAKNTDWKVLWFYYGLVISYVRYSKSNYAEQKFYKMNK